MNKRFLVNISVFSISILLHLLHLLLTFRLQEPVVSDEVFPAFTMIDAVIVEKPQAVFIPPPPPLEQEKIEELNEAVTPDDKVEETPEEELQKPEPAISSNTITNSKSDSSVNPTGTNYIPFYKVEKRPEFTHQAALEYPSQARRLKIEGTVIIEADIDSEGNLVQIRLIRNAGFGFDEAAIAMMEASAFSPAMMDGRAVGVRMRFTIKFEI